MNTNQIYNTIKIITFTKHGGVADYWEKEIRAFQPPPLREKPNFASTKPYTRISHTAFKVFYENEFAAYKGEALIRSQIQEYLQKKHPSPGIKTKFSNYKLTVGMLRRRYNNFNLYVCQPHIALLSFEYDELGYIVAGGYKPHEYMSFDDCRKFCIKQKVADPRFMTHEEIIEIRNQQLQGNPDWLSWVVPGEEELKTFRSKANVTTIFNSVKFREGFGYQETLDEKDTSPPSQETNS